MQSLSAPITVVQSIDSATNKGGKKRTKFRRRLAPADLSDSVRERIATLYSFHEDPERTAEIACREFPGIRITASLVIAVYVLTVRRTSPIQGRAA